LPVTESTEIVAPTMPTKMIRSLRPPQRVRFNLKTRHIVPPSGNPSFSWVLGFHVR
jgi:hypothetical protein